jgi:hypothetical protein
MSLRRPSQIAVLNVFVGLLDIDAGDITGCGCNANAGDLHLHGFAVGHVLATQERRMESPIYCARPLKLGSP